MKKCKTAELSAAKGHKGSKCYTDGYKTILIFSDEQIPEGFYPGRKPTNWHPWSKGLTKETSEKVLQRDLNRLNSRVYKPLSEDHKEKISNTRKNKQLEPWNKGLTKETDERVKKASEIISVGLRDHHKNAILKDPLFYEKQKKKLNETMHKNNSFARSKTEDLYYGYLCEMYGKENVLRQYSEDRYPWKCDFYIKSLDKFIEFNGHWTHGYHPFNACDDNDLATLNLWQEKSNKSNFYKNAIYVWTKADPKKLQTLRDNNLNFEIIYKDLVINS